MESWQSSIMVNGQFATQFISRTGRMLADVFNAKRTTVDNDPRNDSGGKIISRSADNQWLSRKLRERSAIARSFVVKDNLCPSFHTVNNP
jgi:hypothetical protein